MRRVAGGVRARFLYSGGIGSLDDLRGLYALPQVNLGGVVGGKALYGRPFRLAGGQGGLDGRA